MTAAEARCPVQHNGCRARAGQLNSVGVRPWVGRIHVRQSRLIAKRVVLDAPPGFVSVGLCHALDQPMAQRMLASSHHRCFGLPEG
jgi:hypothetical protein